MACYVCLWNRQSLYFYSEKSSENKNTELFESETENPLEKTIFRLICSECVAALKDATFNYELFPFTAISANIDVKNYLNLLLTKIANLLEERVSRDLDELKTLREPMQLEKLASYSLEKLAETFHPDKVDVVLYLERRLNIFVKNMDYIESQLNNLIENIDFYYSCLGKKFGTFLSKVMKYFSDLEHSPNQEEIDLTLSDGISCFEFKGWSCREIYEKDRINVETITALFEPETVIEGAIYRFSFEKPVVFFNHELPIGEYLFSFHLNKRIIKVFTNNLICIGEVTLPFHISGFGYNIAIVKYKDEQYYFLIDCTYLGKYCFDFKGNNISDVDTLLDIASYKAKNKIFIGKNFTLKDSHDSHFYIWRHSAPGAEYDPKDKIFDNNSGEVLINNGDCFYYRKPDHRKNRGDYSIYKIELSIV